MEEVALKLEKTAEEVLSFMALTGLSANDSKTKYLMFNRKKGRPIKVGNAVIEDGDSAFLLGITVGRDLKWRSHLSYVENELNK